MRFNPFNVDFFIKTFVIIFAFAFCSRNFAMEVPVEDFSLAPYSQNVNEYLSPNEVDYKAPLLKMSYQKTQLQQFFNHYYASDAEGLSPWSAQLILKILPTVKGTEQSFIESMSHQSASIDKKHYAENFKEHDAGWLKKIQDNMNIETMSEQGYNSKNRAIAVNNTMARALPDIAPDFYHPSIPGEGFPFDNLQESVVWAGTPLYVMATTKDKAWSLVLTPDAYFAWVKSGDIAYASEPFIQKWQAGAKHGLVAITKTEASILDAQQNFQLTGYIGAVFPLIHRANQETTMMIPVKGSANQAMIKSGHVESRASAQMPMIASKKNMAVLLKQLQNRPYGWGGAFFYNDCSQEMKSLFTPFGFWLPRNSSNQAEMSATMDLSTQNEADRINLLKQNGHPLMTIVYIGGHVMLYVGTNSDKFNQAPITYQNVWGLRDRSHQKRYVIGQSVFIPLLSVFPERPDAQSEASHSKFKLVFLDALAQKNETVQEFYNRYVLKSHHK